MEPLADVARAYLEQVVQKHAPKRLLLIQPDERTRVALNNAAGEDCICEALNATQMLDTDSSVSRFNLAIALPGALPALTAKQGSQLVSRLRDQFAETVIICVDSRAQGRHSWSIADFIALGFRRSPGSQALSSGVSIYRYDIRDYKTTPDWLNSRYWANPGRWDNERW